MNFLQVFSAMCFITLRRHTMTLQTHCVCSENAQVELNTCMAGPVSLLEAGGWMGGNDIDIGESEPLLPRPGALCPPG